LALIVVRVAAVVARNWLPLMYAPEPSVPVDLPGRVGDHVRLRGVRRVANRDARALRRGWKTMSRR